MTMGPMGTRVVHSRSCGKCRSHGDHFNGVNSMLRNSIGVPSDCRQMAPFVTLQLVAWLTNSPLTFTITSVPGT